MWAGSSDHPEPFMGPVISERMVEHLLKAQDDMQDQRRGHPG